MKFGVRTPSIKKSVSARTTGKIKRTVKRSVNPLYGKKGMGMINDPKKAIYNKAYNKTTVSVSDYLSDTSHNQPTEKRDNSGCYVAATMMFILGFIVLIPGLILGIIFPGLATFAKIFFVICILIAIFFIVIGLSKNN